MSHPSKPHQSFPSDDHLRENTLSTRLVFDGVLLKVSQDQVSLPDASSSIREYIHHPGAVVIIPLLDNGHYLLERQFRYPLHQVFLEFPAGKIDPGESILNTAQRELREETGHVAQEWQHLGVMHPCIGYSNERIEIFLAKGLTRVGDQALDDNEFLELLDMSPTQLRAEVLAGRVTDAKTITALYFAEALCR